MTSHTHTHVFSSEMVFINKFINRELLKVFEQHNDELICLLETSIWREAKQEEESPARIFPLQFRWKMMI